MTRFMLSQFAFDRGAILRALAAGSAWGLVVATALLGLSFYRCGTICLGQIADTASLSILAGIVTIGPIAVFRRAAPAPV